MHINHKSDIHLGLDAEIWLIQMSRQDILRFIRQIDKTGFLLFWMQTNDITSNIEYRSQIIFCLSSIWFIQKTWMVVNYLVAINLMIANFRQQSWAADHSRGRIKYVLLMSSWLSLRTKWAYVISNHFFNVRYLKNEEALSIE